MGKKSVAKDLLGWVGASIVASGVVALAVLAVVAGFAGIVALSTGVTAVMFWVLNFVLHKALLVKMLSFKKDVLLALAFTILRSLFRSSFVRNNVQVQS